MRIILSGVLLATLAACSDTEVATFACPNGPDLAVTYSGDSATIALNDGRTEILPRVTEGEEVYAKPGMVWQETSFRSARLTDGQRSYACDQSSVR